MKFTAGRRAYASLIERLAANSVPEDNGHDSLCWIWTGKRDHRGYGRMNVWISGKGSRSLAAHRVALAIKLDLAYDELPPELDAAHQCHVRACINPSHVEPRTRSTNVREAIERATSQGRLWRPDFLRFTKGRSNGKAHAERGGTSRTVNAENDNAQACGWLDHGASGFDPPDC